MMASSGSGGLLIEDEDVSSLSLESVVFHSENRTLHHTNQFELTDGRSPTPIFRRGQTLLADLNFNKDYKPVEDEIHLTVSYGPVASFNMGTKFKIPVSEKEEIHVEEWNMWITEIKGSVVAIKVYIPTKAQVGVWRYQINLSKKDSSETDSRETLPENILYILFNPWCKDDDVYMEEEQLREKYVLSHTGIIFRGGWQNPSHMHWVFGQFDYAVLPTIILLLERSELKYHNRGSAYLVARALSALINVQDDSGLIVGRWDGNYKGGSDPNKWTGSSAIFQEYLNSGGSPVKYGQCWVFAACITTACRALGIPCRLISCFNSAFDKNQSLTVDFFYNLKHEKMPSEEIIWNYHCWNEVWFTRPDLSPYYNGWQVIDATPQDKSKGRYRCGPAPVKAVLEADFGLLYEVVHVFAEVNADVCSFIEDPKSSWGYKLTNLDTTTVGILIVTESLNSQMENLTKLYKYDNETKEREIFYKALKQLPSAQTLYERFIPISTVKNVNFTMDKISSVAFGQSFEVSVSAKNESAKSQIVEVSLSATGVFNDGGTIGVIKKGKTEVSLKPQELKVFKLEVSIDDYNSKVNQSEPLVRAVVTAKVVDTQEIFHNEKVFEISHTDLTMEAPNTVVIEDEFKVKFSFTNLIGMELTNCFLIIEAAGLLHPREIRLRNVSAKAKMEKTVKILSKRVGKFILVGKFVSDQLSNIRGKIEITVKDANI